MDTEEEIARLKTGLEFRNKDVTFHNRPSSCFSSKGQSTKKGLLRMYEDTVELATLRCDGN